MKIVINSEYKVVITTGQDLILFNNGYQNFVSFFQEIVEDWTKINYRKDLPTKNKMTSCFPEGIYEFYTKGRSFSG